MEWSVRLTQQYLVDVIVPYEYRSEAFLPTELFSIWLLLATGGVFFYFFFASLSYFVSFVWNKEQYYPQTLKQNLDDQISVETGIAFRNLPIMAIFFVPFLYGTIHGYSRMYYNVDDYGWGYLLASIPFFFFFTDFMIYWNHRILHQGLIYKYIHKPHHTYRFTTPYSSHAFHFLDGWGQGVPYYIFCFLFPFHHVLFMASFIFVNMWTISIHDQIDFTGQLDFVNSTDHHTVHHVDFNYNYGQYFTLWDRLGGSYKTSYQTHDFVTGAKLNIDKLLNRMGRKEREEILAERS
eukprot:TRINITY_DN838_c0_g1_i1.p1 TRINITY_DN838_c0_g1~~TRINITY_DN838_c0_g1_i1.p1  ORF type:complete len:293 (+),score=45.59 TRINITY_DN838_c0_g1_i1:266-1144(+)